MALWLLDSLIINHHYCYWLLVVGWSANRKKESHTDGFLLPLVVPVWCQWKKLFYSFNSNSFLIYIKNEEAE
jgi:hypothetical protein